MAARKKTSRAQLKRHVQETYKRGLAVAAKYREAAAVNQSFTQSDQWGHVGYEHGQLRVRKDHWFDDEKVPRIAVNECTNTLMTWSALMTKDRPTVTAVQATDEPEDAYKAEIGNRIIEFLEQELDAANKVGKTFYAAGRDGTAGLKIIFDENEDKVTWSKLTIADYVIDPRSPDWTLARWVIFEDHCTEDEALDLFEANKIDKKPKLDKYKNAAGDEVEGVKRLEHWELPCRDYPQGLFVCLVDDEVVDVREEYPVSYTDDSGKVQYPLPIVLMRVRDIGSVYGGTNFSDVVPLQRGFNECVSRIQKGIRDTSQRHLPLPKSLIAAGFNLASTSVIEVPDNKFATFGNKFKWTDPGEPPASLERQRDFFEKKMPSVMGLNDTTLGKEKRVMSGVAIENLVELDEQRNSDATKEGQTMIRAAWELTWRLVGIFYNEMRKAKITGASPEDVLAYNRTDVDGMDVKLELASEVDKMSAVRTTSTAEKVQMGVASPMDLDKAKKSPGYGFSARAAEAVIGEYLEMGAVEVMPDDINLDVLLEVIRKHMSRALAKRNRDVWVRLERLRRDVVAMRPQAATAAPGAPAPEPSGPPAPAPLPS